MGDFMKWKVMFILVVVIVVFSMFYIYHTQEHSNSEVGYIKTLYASTEGPIKLNELIDEIESGKYYEGYDNDTLNWMKSLGDMEVFPGEGYYVVMDSEDASKLHSDYIDDAYITQKFTCEVLENHSLGNIKYPQDIVFVRNVEYISENFTSLWS